MTDELTSGEEPEQLPLLSSAEMPDNLFEELEKGERGDYTLERLRKYHPNKYKHIVACLAEGSSMRRTATINKCSRETVAEVYEAEAEAIRPLKDTISKLAARGARMTVERIIEEIDSIPVDKLGVTFGILVDKMQLLSGGATARIDHTQQESVSDLTEVLNRLNHKVIDAEIVELTGLDAKIKDQKAIVDDGPGIDLNQELEPSKSKLKEDI